MILLQPQAFCDACIMQNCINFGHCCTLDRAVAAYEAPQSTPLPHPSRHIQALDLGVFGTLLLTPSPTQIPSYASTRYAVRTPCQKILATPLH